jgi:hypothetical protein
MEKPIKYYIEILSMSHRGRIISGYTLLDSTEADIIKARRHISCVGERHPKGDLPLRIYRPESRKATYFVFEGDVENPLSPIQETFPASIVNYGLSAKAQHISGQFSSMFKKSALVKTLDTLMDF